MLELKTGDPVRFEGRLGVFPEGTTEGGLTAFVGGVTTEAGEAGSYVGVHPNPELAAQGWHFALLERDGQRYMVPGHIPAHFVPAGKESGRAELGDPAATKNT